jgi:hypothetical protein
VAVKEVIRLEKRILEKKGKEYVLTLEDEENKATTIKRYSRDEMFENYDLVMSTVSQLKGAATTTRNQLKNLGKVEETEELKAFVEMLESSMKIRKKRELEAQLKAQEEQLEKAKQQEREIVRAVPEVLRREQKRE